MPANPRKEDLRCIKTEKALDIAMFTLLSKRNFRRITVHNICTAALISRATFYAHYTDKYDFLKDWLMRIGPQNLTFYEPYEYIENLINKFMLEHKLIIRNIVNDATKETLDVLHHVVISFLKLKSRVDTIGSDAKYIIFSNIYGGGIMQYILWQMNNNFPANVPLMNRPLYEIIKKCRELEEE